MSIGSLFSIHQKINLIYETTLNYSFLSNDLLNNNRKQMIMSEEPVLNLVFCLNYFDDIQSVGRWVSGRWVGGSMVGGSVVVGFNKTRNKVVKNVDSDTDKQFIEHVNISGKWE